MISFGFITREANANARCCQRSWSCPPLIPALLPIPLLARHLRFLAGTVAFWMSSFLAHKQAVARGGEKALLGTQHHAFISLSFISSLALPIKFPTEDIYFPSMLCLFFSHFIYCQLTDLPELSRISR